MADIANLKIGNQTYSIKDPTARTNASNAQTTATSAEAKADQAILDSATAQSTANTANTNAQNAQSTANSANTSASNANTKIDGASIVGEYTSGTETLEISFEIGSLSNS
jgi:hypothetical protein